MPPRSKKRAATAPPDPATDGFMAWLLRNGARLDGMAIKNVPGYGVGTMATRDFAPGEALGFVPKELILDPLEVLASDAIACEAQRQGGTSAFSFWLALASFARDAAHPLSGYFAALPKESPEPLAWSTDERALLSGTQLGTQVESQRRMLRDEFQRVGKRVAPHVSFDDLLWARGVHLSRCFPRALVEAAALGTAHEVLGSDKIESSLTVEQGGGAAARVTWSAAATAAASGAAASGASGSGATGSATTGSGATGSGATSSGHAGGAKDARSGGEARAKRSKRAAETGGMGAEMPSRMKAALERQQGEEAAHHHDCCDHDHASGHGHEHAHATRPSSGEAPTDPVTAAAAASGDGDDDDDDPHAAGNLGCMVPLCDSFDHRSAHPIGWEAGGGGVRFRCKVPVGAGAPLYSNYGAKGNHELLFTCAAAHRNAGRAACSTVEHAVQPRAVPGSLARRVREQVRLR